MEIISNPSQAEIKKAAQALKDGYLVAFPTETVYGLGADATNENAVSRIYSVKGRPTNHPLIIHISSINQLDKWAVDIPEYAIKLAKEFWPGPMTLILKKSPIAKNFLTGGQDNVGVRVPAHSVALALLSEFEKLGGAGIAAPSANRFGAISPTTADAVNYELGTYLGVSDLVLNGGQSSIGIESSIIDCISPVPSILRPGAVTQGMIKNVIGIIVNTVDYKSKIKAPGMLGAHYSPKAKVLLNTSAKPGEGFIALADVPTPIGAVRLGAPKNTEQFARELYSSLRKGDARGITTVSIILPAGIGLAEAIKDRMIKASAD
jgi:L-threonylcarbamoyladenylate synthase